MESPSARCNPWAAPADYVLFVDGKALGILEAKKEGTTLSAVAEQSARYTDARKWIPQRWADPLPFTYESTGIEASLEDSENLPPPAELAAEIVESPEAALEEFHAVEEALANTDSE